MIGTMIRVNQPLRLKEVPHEPQTVHNQLECITNFPPWMSQLKEKYIIYYRVFFLNFLKDFS